MALKRGKSGFLSEIEARLARAREEEERLHRKLSQAKNLVKHETVKEQTERELIRRQLADIEHQRLMQAIESGVVAPLPLLPPLPPPAGQPVQLNPLCPKCQRRIPVRRYDYHVERCDPDIGSAYSPVESRYSGRQVDYRYFQGS